jgi:hypothetical protein
MVTKLFDEYVAVIRRECVYEVRGKDNAVANLPAGLSRGQRRDNSNTSRKSRDIEKLLGSSRTSLVDHLPGIIGTP